MSKNALPKNRDLDALLEKEHKNSMVDGTVDRKKMHPGMRKLSDCSSW